MSSPRRLRTLVAQGADMPLALVHEAWELRLTMLRLTRSRADDWAYFERFVRQPDRCLFVFKDDDGRLRGFFTVAFVPLDLTGRRDLLMYSKYFYIHADWRGHPQTILSPWRLLPMSLRAFGPRRLHFVTTAFPQSYVSLSRTSGGVVTLRDPDTTAWQRTALETFARTFCDSDFDAQRGVVTGSNVADSASLPRSEDATRLFERYEQLNPWWREGVSLPILFSVDAGLVRHNAIRVARRALRR